MRKMQLFTVFASVSAILFFCSCGRQIVYCPPNNEPTVLYDIKEAFPVFEANYEITAAAAVSKIAGILDDASISAGVKNNMRVFRDNLNQESSRMEMELKSALLGLQTTPCNAGARENFWNMQKLIAEQGKNLAMINEKLAEVRPPDKSPGGNKGNEEALKAIREYKFIK